ncbi:MAG: Lrp/AsnC family transcriptional regulator [Candidatus Bathyarchaeia archaeon]
MSSKIDETDKTILEMLQEDSRTPFARIAEKLNVSEATVFMRVKKLLEKGIIKRLTALINPAMVGKEITAFVLINADPKRLPHVFEVLSKMDDIYEVYDVTGAYYVIAKIRTENSEKLTRIIDEIGFIDGVTSTETAITLRCIKEETRIKL